MSTGDYRDTPRKMELKSSYFAARNFSLEVSDSEVSGSSHRGEGIIQGWTTSAPLSRNAKGCRVFQKLDVDVFDVQGATGTK